MGWGKILGDLAKGYVSARGVEGTIEDITKLTQKGGEVINMFSEKLDKMFEGDAGDNAWDDFLGEYQACLDDNQYEEAVELLDSYFEHYEYEKNFNYYYLRAFALIQQWNNSEELGLSEEDEVPLIVQSSKDIKKCIKLAEDTEQKNLAVSLQEDFNKVNNQKKYLGLWEKTLGEIEKYCDLEAVYTSSKKTDCEKAFSILSNLYDEMGEARNWFYFYKRGSIYNALFAAFIKIPSERNLLNPEELEKYISDALDCIKRAENLYEGDDEEDIHSLNRLKEQYNEIVALLKEGVGHENTVSLKENTDTPSSSDAEKEYLEELKECLKNGITDRERRLLYRLSKSLGISETRALELEKSLNSSLTDEEQEYLEELKDILKDGRISDRERRLLDRLRKSLGISEARGRDLEKMAQ